MERLELLDPLALLALLEKEESKDSLDPLASRVCLVLLAHLEREASLVTWVFQERVEPPAPLDPEVSEGSQEREEVLGPRVSRDPAVCLEHPELTDPREPLGLAVPPVPRAPPACRVCLEREEPLVSQDPRVTGEITVRKDLRVLLARMDPGV